MERKIFFTDKNKSLCGLLNINNIKNDTVVVICHARTSSKDSKPTTNLSLELNENNINNFRFDFVSCGESEGDYTDYTVTNMVSNLNAALEILKKDYRFQNFILIGCSMGGRIVSLVDYDKFNIIKLILWYPALDFKTKILNLLGKKEKLAKKYGYCKIEKDHKLCYEYFRDERKYRAYKNLYKWKVDKLFVHGNEDPFVDVKSSIKVSKKCSNSKLKVIKNGDHGFHNEICMKEALKVTLSFINNSF